VLPKKFEKKKPGSYLNKTITSQQWCLSLLLLDLNHAKESHNVLNRKICGLLFISFIALHASILTMNIATLPYTSFFPSNCFCKPKWTQDHIAKKLCVEIYILLPLALLEKNLWLSLWGLWFWMCFVANGVKWLSMIHHSSCTQRCWEKLWFWFQQNYLWLFHLSSFELICICLTLLLEKHLKCCDWEFFFGYSSLILGFCPECGSLQG
jgi:hypothetical protein